MGGVISSAVINAMHKKIFFEVFNNLLLAIDDAPSPKDQQNNDDEFQNCWNAAACQKGIEIIGPKCLTVHYKGNGGNSGFRSALAKQPILLDKNSSGIFYFEIAIVNMKRRSLFGFVSKKHNELGVTVQARSGTYAYTSNGLFCIGGTSKRGNPSFSRGDVVGCGLNLATGEIIFTKNSVQIATSNLFISASADHLFPFVSLGECGDKIEANFGPNFKFDIAKVKIVSISQQQNCWDPNACHNDLEITDDKCLTVNYKATDKENWWRAIFAKHSFLKSADSSRIFYFEISLLNKKGLIIFGLGPKQLCQLDKRSFDCADTYVYASGGSFWINGNMRHFINSFDVGDTVGFGVNLANRQIFITKNGQFLESSFILLVSPSVTSLVPLVSLFNSGDKISANFGPKFKFDLTNLTNRLSAIRITVAVHTLTGMQFTLGVEADATVEQIKAKIQDMKGFPAHQQMLSFRADGNSLKLLEDNLSLAHYNIRNKCTLILTLEQQSPLIAIGPSAVDGAADTKQIIGEINASAEKDNEDKQRERRDRERQREERETEERERRDRVRRNMERTEQERRARVEREEESEERERRDRVRRNMERTEQERRARVEREEESERAWTSHAKGNHSPLWTAIIWRNIIPLDLLKKGADSNEIITLTHEGQQERTLSPLHFFVDKSHMGICKLLVSNGAKVDHGVGHRGITPLHLACEKGQMQIVRFLVEEAKADFELADFVGSSPLIYAAMEQNWMVFDYLVEKGAKIARTNKQGISLLHFIAKDGNFEYCKKLVDKGINVNQQTADCCGGSTPLHLACENGHLDIVELLVEKGGADFEIADSVDGDTPLMCAVMERDLAIIGYLIKKGASTDRTNKKGISPLHYAAKIGTFDVCKLLMSSGANVNQQTTADGTGEAFGCTPLLFACSGGHLGIVKLLVEKGGADLAIANSAGHSPLIYAKIGRNLEIVRYLISKEATTASDQPSSNSEDRSRCFPKKPEEEEDKDSSNTCGQYYEHSPMEGCSSDFRLNRVEHKIVGMQMRATTTSQ
ncbi:hypothetical protein niasHT_017805 [Heterodera trifolii]|uniref:B30.2/SPRY domain-containing protein n=1 Tax=Heterodera trifolii TaxID=157864 RepID=A0ABD2KVW3_9BILA